MKMNFIKVTQIIAVSIAFCSLSFGQVGVNTANPNSSAALEVVSPSASDNRGVLLPRMTTAQMTTIATNATTVGLMVFNTDEKSFYYHDGTNWIALVPKQPLTTNSNVPQKIGNIVIDSGAVITQNATVNGDLNVNGFAQNALVPTGAIMMWSGDPNALPAGWGLCNGNYYWTNGPALGATSPPLPPYFLGFQLIQSPDLSGRFIAGYGQNQNPVIGDLNPNYVVGQTGGENLHQLINSELPTHRHTVNSTTTDGGTVLIADDTHSHNYSGGTNFMSDDTNSGEHTDGSGSQNNGNQTLPSIASDTHNHGISGETGNGQTDGLNNQRHENRPPYYVLAYIIKLP